MTSVSLRDPYPYPKYENDLTLANFKTDAKKERSTLNEETFDRLSKTATYSSLRHSVVVEDARSPKDSLDFLLKTQYDNHRQFLKGKNEVCLQKETLGDVVNNKLRQNTALKTKQNTATNSPKIVIAESKLSPHSVKNSISGHHTQTTNCGYSRKPDGGLYTS